MTLPRREVLRWGAILAAGSALGACSSGSPASAPSPTSTGLADSAEQMAALALWAAQQGADSGSYGIGGALVDSNGTVLQTLHNRVFERLSPDVQAQSGTAFVSDPTAHGERQLMSWYLANRVSLGLPEPGSLTVVTSVDPCLMCASALLTGGVNVGVVAPDDYSGINYDLSGTFTALPEPLRGRAIESFGYYAVSGVRPYQGASATAFSGTEVSSDTYDDCVNLYATSADTVRAERRGSGTPPSQLLDPGTQAQAIDVVRAFQVVYPEAFTVRVSDPRRPGREVRDALTRLVAANPGSTNAVGFVDPFGNLACAAADQSAVNPLSTAFALCTRAYARTRFALVDSPMTNAIAQQALTNPTFGTFVFLVAPDPFTSVGMFDLGAYGSTLGGQASPFIPSNFQYFDLPPNVTERDLQDVVYPLPPLYSDRIKISPQRIGAS